MKIFSLKSKWSLVAWSVVLGAIFDLIFLKFSARSLPYDCYVLPGGTSGCGGGSWIGWPFSYQIGVSGTGYIDRIWVAVGVNLIFWILLSFLVLSLIRWAKQRKSSSKSPSPSNGEEIIL